MPIERKFRAYDPAIDYIGEFSSVTYLNCDGDKVVLDWGGGANHPDHHGPVYTIFPKDGGKLTTFWPEGWK
jgi:hypothetical protein